MTRSALHALVDDLPDALVDDASALLKAYRQGDRMTVLMLTAPTGPAEADELTALDEQTRADLEPSRPFEDVAAELGI